MKLFKVLYRYKHYLMHPIGRCNRFSTVLRIIRWQLGSRMLDKSVVMSFVNDTRLLVSTGMRGATGNIYVGLVEFEDMAFVLHMLDKGDVFIDVGAM